MQIMQQRHEVPANFRRLLGTRLRRLVAQEKLEKVCFCLFSLPFLLVSKYFYQNYLLDPLMCQFEISPFQVAHCIFVTHFQYCWVVQKVKLLTEDFLLRIIFFQCPAPQLFLYLLNLLRHLLMVSVKDGFRVISLYYQIPSGLPAL